MRIYKYFWNWQFVILIVLIALLNASAPVTTAAAAMSNQPALSVAAGACGNVFYVNRAATGSNDGSSWTNAFTTLQDALAQIALCPATAEIWVASGVYYPDEGAGQTNDDRNATFQLASGVAIYGGFAGTETARNDRNWFANLTILSGDLDQNDTTDADGVVIDVANLQGANAYHVVTGSDADNTAVLDGFVITAGHANGAFPQNIGAGVFIQTGSPTLRNLVVRGNQAGSGGGLFNGANSSPMLDTVLFRDNAATANGGGVANVTASPTLLAVNFIDNQATLGGGMSADGVSNLSLTGVTFSGNRAATGGGLGLFGSHATLTGVTLNGNQATADGGGIYHVGGKLTLVNVTVSGNQATGNGGGLYYFLTAATLGAAGGNNVVTLSNTTFNGNQAATGGAIANINGTISATNSILANSPSGGNCSGVISSNDYNLSTDATCSLTQPHDRTNSDPKLESLADNGGPTQTHGLQDDSPAIDAGDCSGGAVMTDQRGVQRPQGAACDIGAFEKAEVATFDYGDAPDPTYPTLKAHNGARHGLLTNLWLGSTVDAETDGQPDVSATGDDNNGDDEDGVALPAELKLCTVTSVNVTTSAPGRLHGWVDFNNDGDWRDAGERIFNAVTLPAGTQPLTFYVPCDATLTDATFARFRYTSAAILAVDGEAFDGEVEDYQVAIRRGPPQAVDDSAQTAEDSAVLVNVLANDRDPGNALALDSIARPPANGVAALEGNAIRYTPNPHFYGVDSFDYVVRNELNLSARATVRVMITSVNDAPTDIGLSNTQVDALAPIGTVVGVLSTVDIDADDTHVYQLDSEVAGAFSLTENELRTATLFNPRRRNSYKLRITSTDRNNGQIEKEFTIAIVTSTPVGITDLQLSNQQVRENLAAGATVGTLTASDPRNLPHTFALVSGAGDQHNSYFTIQANQLRTAASLDFETVSVASIRVRVTNGVDDPYEEIFLIKIIDDPSDTRPPFQACSGNDIHLITSTDGKTAVTIRQIRISEPSLNGCVVEGKMSVLIPGGSKAENIDFRGRVDKRGRLQSYDAFVGDTIGAFTLDPAGIPIQFSNTVIEYYAERPSLRIKKATSCMPAEWGGECVSVPAITWLIDSSGFNFGGPASQPPKIPFAKLVSKRGFGVSAIYGNFKRVANGYEFTAGGTFVIPRFAYTSGCGLAVIVTFFRDASGFAAMRISTPTAPNAPLAVNTANRIGLSELTLGMDCAGLQQKPSAGNVIKATGGIPIGNTGLLVTQVFGTVSLRPDNQFVRLSLRVDTVTKLPLPAPANKPLVTMEATTTVHIQPEWGLDLAGAIKVIGLIEAASGQASVRKDRFSTTLTINLLWVSGTGRIDAWTSSGNRFHFTGRGVVHLRVVEGAIHQSCEDLPCGVRWCEGGLFGWGYPCTSYCRICLSIPPFGFTTGDLGVDLGEFTNGKYGIKGYVEVLNKQYGFYVDENGTPHFGGVSGYILATPPALAAARLQQQAVQAAQADQLSLDPTRVDDRYTFLSDHEVLIKTSIGPAAVAASDSVSLVNVAQTSDVLFTLSADPGMSMTLFTPSNVEITSDNYNTAPVAPAHRVNYTETLIYQPERSVASDEETFARLRFAPASLRSDLEAVDVRIDGAVIWSGAGLKLPEARDYVLLTPGEHTVELTPVGGSDVLLSTTVSAAAGEEYTLVAAGKETAQLLILPDDNQAPPLNHARVRFVQSAEGVATANVTINGAPLATGTGYGEASSYLAVPAGEALVEIKDAATNNDIAPPRALVFEAGLVYTLYAVNWDTNGYQMDFGQLIDEAYVGRLFIQYDVAQAQVGDWRLKLSGNLETNNYMAAVLGVAAPTTLANVTVDATNLRQTQVNWVLHSDYAPTKATIYLTRDPMTQTMTYTETNGAPAQRQVTNYTGFAVAEFTITDPAQLQGGPTTQVIDLSNAPSGQYRMWVRADNDEMPPASAYALAPDTSEAAVINIDHSATFPTNWTATITPTLVTETLTLNVAWEPLAHVDIDFYNVYLGTSSLNYTSVISGLVASPVFDEDGNVIAAPVGLAVFDHMRPNLDYYLVVEAGDEESGHTVRSQEVVVSFAAGDYQLISPQTTYSVMQGGSRAILVSLQEIQPLFFREVPLAINDDGLPSGLLVYFQNQLETPPTLRVGTSDPADREVNLLVEVGETLSSGAYTVMVTGYNGDDLERNLTVTLQVGTPANAIYLPVVAQGNPAQATTNTGYLPIVAQDNPSQ